MSLSNIIQGIQWVSPRETEGSTIQPATAQESTQWLPIQYFWEVCKAHDIFDLTGLI